MEKRDNYTLEAVWQNLSDDTAEEIMEFWRETDAIPNSEQRKRRVSQAALIVRGPENTVVGIITAYKKFNRRLDNYFYYLRGMVHHQHQHAGLGRLLSEGTKAFFETRFKNGQDSEVIGLFMEVENAFLKKHRRQANSEGFIFVGKNAAGDHCRVYYFADALI